MITIRSHTTRHQGITAPPIVMSDLMTSPEMEAIKRRAGLVDDFVVRITQANLIINIINKISILHFRW